MTKKAKPAADAGVKKTTARGKAVLTDFGDKPPIIYDMTNDQYHNASGLSRSVLWTAWKRTPAHARFSPRAETSPMKLGSAAGDAILQPDEFEKKYMRGPEARGNSKVWTDAAEDAKAAGCVLLKPDEFDAALCMRESAHATSSLRKLITGAQIEKAAFVIDEETGLLVKVKPDLYNSDLRIMADIKKTKDAGIPDFSRSIGRYGYHFQEAFYTRYWRQVASVDAMVFIVIEGEAPYLAAQYELPPAAAREGEAIRRAAMTMYGDCVKSNKFPGYPDKVVPIDLNRWDYVLTRPDDGE